MDASSVDSPSKHLVGNETDKTLILSCESQMENNVSSKMDKRILALETTLQELGGHFIKYQEDVMGILVQECSRLTQQMYEQKEKIQKMTHDQVQNALSRTHDDIFHELRTEMKRLLESNITSMNESRDTMSQKETASTAASEDPDASVELRKLRDEMRKEIHEVHSVLNVRASATEKRLEELESGISFQGNEVGPLTKKTHAGVSLSQQRRALSRDASIRLSTTREASPMPVISMGDHINELIREQSAQPAPPPRLAWKQTLEEWRRSTLLLTTQPSPAIRSSDIMSAAENLRKAPAPNESVYQGMGSCQIPVPVLEGNKRAGSIQLRVQDGTMSLNVPRHDALSRSMPRMAASPFAPRSRMSMTVRDAASPPPGVRSNDRTDSAFQTSWSKPASSPFVRGTPKISPSQYQKGFPTMGVAGLVRSPVQLMSPTGDSDNLPLLATEKTRTKKPLTRFGSFLITFLVILSTCTVAIAVPSIVELLGVLGGFCAVALMFVFPTFFYAKTQGGWRTAFAVFIATIFSAIGLIAAVGSMMPQRRSSV